jgi:hypothetical protein
MVLLVVVVAAVLGAIVYLVSLLTQVASEVTEELYRPRPSIAWVVVNETGTYVAIRAAQPVELEFLYVRDLRTNRVWVYRLNGTWVGPGITVVHVPEPTDPTSEYLISVGGGIAGVASTTYPYPNVTQLPRPTVKQQLLQLVGIASQGTVTWQGSAGIPELEVRNGTVYYVEVLNGTYVEGTASSLESRDGDTYVVETEVEPVRDLVLVRDMTIIYTSFDQDPFAAGLLTVVSGNWSYETGFGYDDSTSVSATDTAACDQTGGECISIFNSNIPDSFYAIVAVLHGDTVGYADTILFNDTNAFYTLGTWVDGDAIEIWRYYGAWDLLASTPAIIRSNTWYMYLIRYDRGSMEIQVYDTRFRVFVDSISAYDTTIAPVRFGLGLYGAGPKFFDEVVIATGNPRYLNITNIPPGGSVELYDSNQLVAVGVDDDGDGVVVLDVLYNPIIEEPRIIIRDAAGEVVYNSTLDHPVVGAQVYRFVEAYVAGVEVRSSIDIASVVVLKRIDVNVTANTSLAQLEAFELQAYNWLYGVFEPANCTFYEEAGWTTWTCRLESWYINSANGTVVYRLYFYLTSVLRVAIDEANAYAHVETVRQVFDALVVGMGGTSNIDIYTVSASGSTITINYMLRMTVPAYVFDASIDLTYSTLTHRLYLVTPDGVYTSPLGGSWELLTTQCGSQGLGARIEALNTSRRLYLVVLRGVSDEYCVIEVEPLRHVVVNIVQGRIGSDVGVNVVVQEYAVTATNGTTLWAIVVAANSPTVVRFSLSTMRFELAGSAPVAKPVGLAYDPKGYLWMIAEAGGIYRYDVSTATWEPISIPLPFYPRGAGDRLEYYRGWLIVVRGDDTVDVLGVYVS